MNTQIRQTSTRWLTSTVFVIGLASLFGDLSHEAVTAVLPALLASMGVAAGAVGTIEGVAEGLSSAAKLCGEPYLQGRDNVALPESERSCSSGGHDMTIASLTTGFHFSRSHQISGVLVRHGLDYLVGSLV